MIPLAIAPYKVFIPALFIICVIYISAAIFFNYLKRRKERKKR
jgi:hypothetical protein